MMNNVNIIKRLTYLGALPFFIAIYLTLSNHNLLGITGEQWFLSYGLVILSFMAGTLWGQVINENIRVKCIALTTNIITLTAWVAFLIAAPSIVVILIASGFIALFLLEALMMRNIKRPHYYLSLRLRVTTLVVIAHLGMLFWVL